MLNRLLILCFLMVFASCDNETSVSFIDVERLEQPIIIKNVSIFNGRDSIILTNQIVRIENGNIVSIDTVGFIDTSGCVIIDGQHKFLMPGLIDSHVHLSGSGAVPWQNVKADIPYNLMAYLYCGITTIYDLGGLSSQMNKISTQIEKGELVGPDLYHTHIPITVKNSHPIPLTREMLWWPLSAMINKMAPTVTSDTDLDEFIDEYSKNDIDFVKIAHDQIPEGSPEMSVALMGGLIKSAHQAGYSAFVHTGSPENALSAAKEGADALAHCIWRGELTDEMADSIVKQNVPLMTTLSGFFNVNAIYEQSFEPSELDQLLVPTCVIHPVAGLNSSDLTKSPVMHSFFEDVHNYTHLLKSNFLKLYRRNITFLVGTDSSLPGTYAGSTYYQELLILKEWGISHFEILRAATYYPAKLMEKSPSFGWINDGNKAHLLLLNDNPLENLEAVFSPELIIKDDLLIRRIE